MNKQSFLVFHWATGVSTPPDRPPSGGVLDASSSASPGGGGAGGLSCRDPSLN